MDSLFERLRLALPDLALMSITVRIRGREFAITQLPGVAAWTVIQIGVRNGTGMVLKTPERVLATILAHVKGEPYGIQ